MSLRKSIISGKEYRKPYRGSKRFDRSCRNHGGCPYCEKGRSYKHKKRSPIVDTYEEEYFLYEYPNICLEIRDQEYSVKRLL